LKKTVHIQLKWTYKNGFSDVIKELPFILKTLRHYNSIQDYLVNLQNTKELTNVIDKSKKQVYY